MIHFYQFQFLVAAQWGNAEQVHRTQARLQHEPAPYKGQMQYQEQKKVKQKRYYTSREHPKSWNVGPEGYQEKNKRLAEQAAATIV